MSKYSENMPPDIFGAIGWMFDYIKPGGILLDFGCSTGYFGSYIKENKNCKVYGVEISNDKDEAKKVLNGVYSFDLDAEWPKKLYERKYDYLFFGDVLEHLKAPEEALEKCTNLLNEGGKIFVSIPNIAHISTRLELLSGSFQYESMGILDNTHLQYFTLKSFIGCANKSGYSAKLVDYTANDIPKEIIQNKLAELGLSAKHSFYDEARKIEARAYQYKFILTKNDKHKTPKNKTVVAQKPLQYRDDIISSYKSQLESLDKHSMDQAKIIDHYLKKAEELGIENMQLHKILDSRSHIRLKRLVYNAKNKIAPKRNGGKG